MTDIRDEHRRRDLALGRLQAIAHVRDDLTAQLVITVRGAFAAGATYDELHVETGLGEKTLRAVVRGAALQDTHTPGLGRSLRARSVATPDAGEAA